MRLFSTAKLVAGLLVASVFITGAMAADNMKIDHNKIVALSETGVFGQFNTYKIDPGYNIIRFKVSKSAYFVIPQFF